MSDQQRAAHHCLVTDSDEAWRDAARAFLRQGVGRLVVSDEPQPILAGLEGQVAQLGARAILLEQGRLSARAATARLRAAVAALPTPVRVVLDAATLAADEPDTLARLEHELPIALGAGLLCRYPRALPPPALLAGLAAHPTLLQDGVVAPNPLYHGPAEPQQASTSLVDALFDASPQALIELDATGQVRRWSRSAVALFGWTSDEVVGRPCPAEPAEPAERRRFAELVTRGLRADGLEARWRGKQGDVAEVVVSLLPLHDATARPAGSLLTIADVGSRRRAEARSQVFYSLTQRLSDAASPHGAARVMLQATEALFPFDLFRLALRRPDGGLQPVLTIDTIDGRHREMPAEAPADERLLAALHDGPRLTGGEPGAAMAVPIRGGGQTIGAVLLECHRVQAYDGADVATLKALADQCGGALHRMRSAEALQQSEARYQALAEHSAVGIWQLSTQGRTLYLNPAMKAMLELEPEADPARVTPAQFLGREDRALLRSHARLHGAGVAASYELVLVGRQGMRRSVLVCGAPVRGADGTVESLVASVIDITERRAAAEALQRLNEELEQRVRERTAELATAVQELESFSFAVSHDLRSPLRSIEGFTRQLSEHLGPTLADDPAEWLRRTRAATARMGQLIEDLLRLSRVSRREMTRQPVDLSAVAEQIRDTLAAGEPGRQATWTIDPGLRVIGDERLLRLAMENLLGNAWKFTGRQPSAHIEVRGEPQGERLEVVIRDNGAGFDMAYADKLFTPFQRLHTRDEFEGTGIGLATVKRVVQRHGGTIRAEAVVDGGAVFRLSLPAAG